MMTREQIEACARNLAKAEKTRSQTGLISLANPSMSMDDAYAIQAEWMRQKYAQGRYSIGRKIGLTSKAMQSALNIDIPDSGVLLDDMMFEDGGVIPAGRFIQPRVEAEIAFIMKDGLQGPDATAIDVLNATAFLQPALEILDTRIVRVDQQTKKTRNVLDTIADNAANAGVVLGGRCVKPLDVDMRWIGAIVSRNGSVEETGLGAGVLNNPATAVAWLANRLAEVGEAILPGEIILSGSFIRPIEALSGSTIFADYGSLGTVSCHFQSE
ncbi:2-oxo-hept-4-ene-1,7-dioate hydratase [Brucella gallinifaecis]|uniref:2-oxo-hepta-3-ene-1,7-dioic acid hydratase n=1 Tax=Brucella gallinifaecis TaxID=215590 RepID=A0A502BN48_9HYPH|nr:2-oxo-hepta-3-ene-1,7-dioic acid hydratase [Brucella gallinifaecis]TPF74688.1 2-oxo-hepta-3-ene-1,7-dioic acid hydratase [Brucella gallinifaecis]